MSDNFNFPSTRYEALALLYVQTRDLSEKSPSDIYAMYIEAHKEIAQISKLNIK